MPSFGGDGGYSFVVPGHDYHLPQIDILWGDPFGLYTAGCVPLHLLALLPDIHYGIYFQDSHVVRPFVFSVFWAFIGGVLLWSAVRGHHMMSADLAESPYPENELKC